MYSVCAQGEYLDQTEGSMEMPGTLISLIVVEVGKWWVSALPKSFENYCSGELLKIGHHFSNKLMLSKKC